MDFGAPITTTSAWLQWSHGHKDNSLSHFDILVPCIDIVRLTITWSQRPHDLNNLDIMWHTSIAIPITIWLRWWFSLSCNFLSQLYILMWWANIIIANNWAGACQKAALSLVPSGQGLLWKCDRCGQRSLWKCHHCGQGSLWKYFCCRLGSL